MSDKTESKEEEKKNLPPKIKTLLLYFFLTLFGLFAIYLIFGSNKEPAEEAQETPKVTETTEKEDKKDDSDSEVSFTINADEEEEDSTEDEDIMEMEEVEDLYADLTISDYYFSTDPKKNEEFTVYIDLFNDGDADAEDFKWEWWSSTDGADCDGDVDLLEAGDSTTVECDFTYDDEDSFHTKAVVDSDDEVDEYDEGNNEWEEEITTLPEDKADLIISEYSFDPVPEKNVPFEVRIGIKNQGSVAAENFWWEWWPTYASYACREQVSVIAPNSEKVVTCDYTYGGWSTYDTRAIADVDNDVDESDETNNVYQEDVVPIH